MKKILPIAVVILLAFALIASLTGLVGKTFGVMYEQMILGTIALILFGVLLYYKYGDKDKDKDEDKDKDSEDISKDDNDEETE